MFLTHGKTVMSSRFLTITILFSALVIFGCRRDARAQGRATESLSSRNLPKIDDVKVPSASVGATRNRRRESSIKTYYVESWKEGLTTVKDRRFVFRIAIGERHIEKTIRDSIGKKRFKLSIDPVESDGAHFGWSIRLTDLAKEKADNLLSPINNWNIDSFKPEYNISDLIYLRLTKRFGEVAVWSVPIESSRIIKVENFYCTIDVLKLNISPKSKYLRSAVVRITFANNPNDSTSARKIGSTRSQDEIQSQIGKANYNKRASSKLSPERSGQWLKTYNQDLGRPTQLSASKPATSSQEHVYYLRGRAVDDAGRPMADALVFLDPLRDDHQVFALTLDSGAVFQAQESTTVPRSVRRLYVTSTIPPNTVELATPPFNRLPRLSQPGFEGKRVLMKEDSEVDVGDVRIQQRYVRVTLHVLDINNQPLLTSEDEWADVWLRLRDLHGEVIQATGLSRADLQRAVDFSRSTVALSVPLGAWFIDASSNGENGPWLTPTSPVNIGQLDKEIDLTLKRSIKP